MGVKPNVVVVPERSNLARILSDKSIRQITYGFQVRLAPTTLSSGLNIETEQSKLGRKSVCFGSTMNVYRKKGAGINISKI